MFTMIVLDVSMVNQSQKVCNVSHTANFGLALVLALYNIIVQLDVSIGGRGIQCTIKQAEVAVTDIGDYGCVVGLELFMLGNGALRSSKSQDRSSCK